MVRNCVTGYQRGENYAGEILRVYKRITHKSLIECRAVQIHDTSTGQWSSCCRTELSICCVMLTSSPVREQTSLSTPGFSLHKELCHRVEEYTRSKTNLKQTHPRRTKPILTGSKASVSNLLICHNKTQNPHRRQQNAEFKQWIIHYS